MPATRRSSLEMGLPGTTPAGPELRGPQVEAPRDLGVLLAGLADDRELSALDLVLGTARTLLDWTIAWPVEVDAVQAGRELERGAAAWVDAQAWRGPCALFLHTLRRTWRDHHARGRDHLQAVLAEEIGLWLWSVEEGLEEFDENTANWNGTPLARGRRLPSRRAAAEHAAAELRHGETVLATAWSDTVARGLETAWMDGKRPRLLIHEGLPELDGRRMARRLVREGVPVTLVYDSALPSWIESADRIWLSTEAIGAREFLARVGTRLLIDEAHRRGVPVSLVATSDKLVPGGELELPAWCAERAELLWEEPEEGVKLELAFHEAVPLDLVDRLITEAGQETPAQLALRALREEPEPPCGALES
jgi:hypothetical protein